jgi:hypothetical protein
VSVVAVTVMRFAGVVVGMPFPLDRVEPGREHLELPRGHLDSVGAANRAV